MIGRSAAIRKTYELAKLVAGRDTTVLVTGETGTGKEVVAQAIHGLSARMKNAFVPVNCAAIPEALLEVELFGHVRGAFIGAVQSRLGRIHVAQGGTLFLDEVGELPLSMQASAQRVFYGNALNQINLSENFLNQDKVSLSSQENALIGADPAAAASQLSQAQTAYQAELAATARVLNLPSLLNFLQ
jgi:DNA-binding NtrC family response regulator